MRNIVIITLEPLGDYGEISEKIGIKFLGVLLIKREDIIKKLELNKLYNYEIVIEIVKQKIQKEEGKLFLLEGWEEHRYESKEIIRCLYMKNQISYWKSEK